MAARDNNALYQIYQRYAHDPAVLQRQLSAYLAMTAAGAKTHDSDVAHMMDASHLVYHFASMNTLCLTFGYTGCSRKNYRDNNGNFS